jgi:Flp pilus assembly protein TadG
MLRWIKIRLKRDQSGSVLVEFALISLALYLIMATAVEFGRMVLVSNVAQNAAHSAAVMLSQYAYAAANSESLTARSFDELLNDPIVLSTIYDPNKLVITDPGTVADLPVLNQILFGTAMIRDVVDGVSVVRYPGAVLSDGNSYRILIPRVTGRDATGTETIEWVNVVEEIPPKLGDPAFFTQGIIAVRINYPYQAAALSSFRPNPGAPSNIVDADGNLGVNEANDAGVTAGASPLQGFTLVGSGRPCVPHDDAPCGGPYTGQYGLGSQLAFAGKTVRPYEQLFWGEAMEIYRRMP